jgi:hypothetical protein
VGLLQSKPPITRLVLDLKSAQSYQVFPNGRTVIIKVSGDTTPAPVEVDDFPPISRPGLINTNFPVRTLPLETGPQTKPSLDVSFRDGLLTIRANKTSLSEVLFAIHQRTGAEIAIPAGAEQEKIVADMGPAPAPEVLAHLLNGSRFNFLILSSATEPGGLDRVILSPRTENGTVAIAPAQDDGQADDEMPMEAAPEPALSAPAPSAELAPRTVPEAVVPQPDDSPE